MTVAQVIAQLEKDKVALMEYLNRKRLSRNDWHAVQDAASDIREIDAKLDILVRVASDTLIHWV